MVAEVEGGCSQKADHTSEIQARQARKKEIKFRFVPVGTEKGVSLEWGAPRAPTCDKSN